MKANSVSELFSLKDWRDNSEHDYGINKYEKKSRTMNAINVTVYPNDLHESLSTDITVKANTKVITRMERMIMILML